MLTVADFDSFFREVHGVDPFPWQRRLLKQVDEEGAWPDLLDLPTGTGKTATLDIAVFALALDAGRDRPRRAPVRIAFVVDRRLIVDDAFSRAEKLERALREAAVATHRLAKRQLTWLRRQPIDLALDAAASDGCRTVAALLEAAGVSRRSVRCNIMVPPMECREHGV